MTGLLVMDEHVGRVCDLRTRMRLTVIPRRTEMPPPPTGDDQFKAKLAWQVLHSFRFCSMGRAAFLFM